MDEPRHIYSDKERALVDDKLHILNAVEAAWGGRVTTVFPRQGHYTRAADVATLPPVTIDRIGELLRYDLAALLAAARNREDA